MVENDRLMSLFHRLRWDMATLIFDGNGFEDSRVRTRCVMPKVVLTFFNVNYKQFYVF